MKATDSGYVPKLKELWGILGQHIKEEEKDDLPALESALAKAEKGTSESLAKNFGRTKMLVPSRSHPSAGENPLFEGQWACLPHLSIILPISSASSLTTLSALTHRRSKWGD